MRGSWRAGVTAFAACLVASASAHAHGDRAVSRTLVDDGRVVVHHSDAQRLGLSPEQFATSFGERPARRAAPRNGDAVTPAATWCGQIRSTDDVEHGRTTLPRYKVVYAHATDVPNRMASASTVPGFGMKHADVLQNAATWVSQKLGERGVRFDYGTSCGPQYLDVLTLPLAHPKDHYNQSAAFRAEAIRDEVLSAREAMGLDRGVWDWLVFTDVGPSPHPLWAFGEAWFEPDTRPDPALNANSRDGQVALLHRGSYDGTFGIGYTAYVATHEILHTLGAVMEGAPHRTPGAHCTDAYSILCYDDDGGGPVEVDVVCPAGGTTVPETQVQFDAVAVDCGGDDYFDLSFGRFGHWNVARHPAACPAATCTASTITPVASVTGSAGAATAGAPVRFDASGSSDRDGTIERFDWDVDADGTTDHTTSGPVLEVAPRRSGSFGGGRVVLTDDDGLTDVAGLPSFTVAGRPPAISVAVPAPQPSGTPVVLDASASTDPDEGGRITAFRFTLPDGTSSSGVSPRFSFTPERPGVVPVRVAATDDEGRTADSVATVTVVNRAPGVSARADRTRPAVGATVTLSARAADPDGDVRELAWDLDGDGRTDATGADVRAVFPDAGRRTVRVTATDDAGGTATDALALEVVRAAATRTSRRSVLPSLRRSRSGLVTAVVRCTKRRTCRLRVSAGAVSRNVRVRAGARRTVKLRLPRRLRARTVRFVLRDRATGRRLAQRVLVAPRR